MHAVDVPSMFMKKGTITLVETPTYGESVTFSISCAVGLVACCGSAVFLGARSL